MNDILSDRTSGSIEIVRKSLSFLELLILYNRLEEAQSFLTRLRDTFPSMAVVINLYRELHSSMDLASIRQFEQKLDVSKSVVHASAIFDNPSIASVMTFSNSSMIEWTLKHSHDNVERVVCIESLPGGEGEILCERLCSNKLDARLIEDNEVETELNEIDCVLIGCDAFCEDMLINKIGTNKLVDTAQKKGKPVYCLASEIKRLPADELRKLPVKDIFERVNYSDNTLRVIW